MSKTIVNRKVYDIPDEVHDYIVDLETRCAKNDGLEAHIKNLQDCDDNNNIVIEQLVAENTELRNEQYLQPHHEPAECPTWWDGCNCTLETLTYNINRAEKAEAENKELRNGIADTIIAMDAYNDIGCLRGRLRILVKENKK